MSRSWSWTVGSRYTESWRARSLRVPRGSVGVSRWTTFERGGADASMIERRLCLSCFDIFLALRSPVADVGALSRGVPDAPLEPGPEPADLVGRLPARIELGHALAHADRVLVVVAGDDRPSTSMPSAASPSEASRTR